MQRIALENLKKWKSRSDKKPLIIPGARQVGKTWLIKNFGIFIIKILLILCLKKRTNEKFVFKRYGYSTYFAWFRNRNLTKN